MHKGISFYTSHVVIFVVGGMTNYTNFNAQSEERQFYA